MLKIEGKKRNCYPSLYPDTAKSRKMNATILRGNAEVINHIGAWATYYMNLQGWSNVTLGRKLGVTRTTLWKLRTGRVQYCSISLLTHLAQALNCSLMDWLRNPVPGEKERRREIEGRAGVFGK